MSPGVTTQCTQSVERSPSKSPREHRTISVRRFLMRSVLQYTMKNVTQWSKKCPGKSVPIIIMKNIMKRSTMFIMITNLTLNYTMLQNKEYFPHFQQTKIVHVQIKTELHDHKLDPKLYDVAK